MEMARKAKPRYFPIFLTLYQSGVRIGECLGLQWDDLKLDPKVREVEVRRSIDDKTGEVGTPKNGKARTVDMSLELLDCLKKLEVQRKKEKLERGWGRCLRGCSARSTRLRLPLTRYGWCSGVS